MPFVFIPLIKLWNRNIQAAIALLLCLYIGIVLPAHHHSDGKDHPRCLLCMVQSQPAEAATVSVPDLFFTQVLEALPCFFQSIQDRGSFVSFQIRAPPA